MIGKNVSDKNGNAVAFNLGIDAKGIDYAQLISRIIKISGDIIGGEGSAIEVISGNEKAQYNKEKKRFEVTSAEGEIEEIKPEFAIDSTVFGGIYAGKISIIATEDGVGVRMRKDIISDVEEIEFDVNGNVMFEEITVEGKKGVKLKVKGLLENKGEVRSEEEKVLIETVGEIRNKGTISSGKGVEVKSDGEIKNEEEGIIGGKKVYSESLGIKNEGKIYAEEEIEIKALEKACNEERGEIGGKKVNIESLREIENKGEIYAKEELRLKAEEEIKNAGEIESIGTLRVESGKEIKNEGKIKGGGEIKIAGGEIRNAGEILGEEEIEIGGSEKTVNEGKIYSGSAVKIGGAKGIENLAGAVIEGGRIEARSGERITNEGTIYAQGGLSLFKAEEEIKNVGKIYGGEVIRIEGTAMRNGVLGILEAGILTIKMSGEISNIGKMGGEEEISIEGDGEIRNEEGGEITSLGKIYLASIGAIRNYGGILAEKEIKAIGLKVINGLGLGSEALISAGKLAHIKAGEKIINYGYIEAFGEKDEEGKIKAGSGELILETTSAKNEDYKINDAGEEFGVILMHSDFSKAEKILEEIREPVEQENFYLNPLAKINLTVSIGFAEFNSEGSLLEDELIKRAETKERK